MSVTVMIGTYAGKGGAGLVPLRFDPALDRWIIGEAIEHVRNASFGVAFDHYAVFVDEEEGQVGLFDGANAYSRLATVASGGAAPCHVAVDPSREWAVVANYGSGSVGLFRLAGGAVQGPLAVHQGTGSGPKADRQEGPHAHWVGFLPDADRLLLVDLGTDRIQMLAIDKERAAFSDASTLYAAPAGSGPRHLVFHPSEARAYLVSELSATVTVLNLAHRGLRAETVLPLPSAGSSLGGAIAIDAAGERLYVTSRGDDSIVTYALDAAGEPSMLDVTASGGASPRHLFLVGAHLLVANEEGGTVCAFRLDHSGLPIEQDRLAVPGAAFIMLGPEQKLLS